MSESLGWAGEPPATSIDCTREVAEQRKLNKERKPNKSRIHQNVVMIKLIIKFIEIQLFDFRQHSKRETIVRAVLDSEYKLVEKEGKGERR